MSRNRTIMHALFVALATTACAEPKQPEPIEVRVLRASEVAWHQDVGDRNGGFTADGKAVPTLAVWMGIDAIDPGNGGLEVIPGSHASLVGNYNKQIKSQLRETGARTAER